MVSRVHLLYCVFYAAAGGHAHKCVVAEAQKPLPLHERHGQHTLVLVKENISGLNQKGADIREADTFPQSMANRHICFLTAV